MQQVYDHQGLVKFALTEANKIPFPSHVLEHQVLTYNGILTVRVINKAMVYKSRFYARLPLLKIPKVEKPNLFLKQLPNKYFPYDEIHHEGDQVVFYTYLLMEGHTIQLLEDARSKMPDYGDEEIMEKLTEKCPIFCQLVKFKYVDYKYECIKCPNPNI